MPSYFGPDGLVDSGEVTLAGGVATVDTGVSKDRDVSLDVSLAPQTDDAEVAADIKADSATGNFVIGIQETDTSVGNPTIAYRVIDTK